MSHASNLSRLEMVKTIAALGAKDCQHAFDRALLHGDIEIARWLLNHGAMIMPGIIMGSCETLNTNGFGFLDDEGAPFTDEKGDAMAPLALVLETYARNPESKHEILRRFRTRGYRLPDTIMMAFHCGELDAFKRHLQHDPALLVKRFSYGDIYPPETGCKQDGRSGMHGTPIEGTTLLHLAIDFDEREIFDWLMEQGADVNAAAIVDAAGFGGHTPIFNAIVCDAYVNGRQRDGYMGRRLLDRGADVGVRVNLRNFLDWRGEPGWHLRYQVRASDFPEAGWVSKEIVQMVSSLML